MLTSSTVAAKRSLRHGEIASATDEGTWSDPEEKGLSEYARSKTLAERAAWEFAQQTTGSMELTTILPGMVLGPVIDRRSLWLSRADLTDADRTVPALPRIGFSVVDVRDLAALHIQAMRAPKAAGQRFLRVSDFLCMEDRANFCGTILAREPQRCLPAVFRNVVFRVAALFQYEARFMAPMLEQRTQFDVSKSAKVLDWHPGQRRRLCLHVRATSSCSVSLCFGLYRSRWAACILDRSGRTKFDVDMNKQGDPSGGCGDQFGDNYSGTFDQNKGVS